MFGSATAWLTSERNTARSVRRCSVECHFERHDPRTPETLICDLTRVGSGRPEYFRLRLERPAAVALWQRMGQELGLLPREEG
jgi:hypothetical protein